MGYKFLEHTADIMFRAWGKNLEELFLSCALALSSSMADLTTVKAVESRRIVLESQNFEELLFNFMNEIIYYKDAEGLIFSKFSLKIQESNIFRVECECFGEKIDLKRHKLGIDVKATTYHKFEVKKGKSRWKATVILDI